MTPLAVAAIGVSAIALPGCNRGEDEKQGTASAAESPLKDAAFREEMKASVRERKDIAKIHSALAAKMREKVKAVRARMGAAAGDEAVGAELAKDPEWQSLERRCKDAAVALREQRHRTAKKVRARLVRPAETKEKDISK